MEFRLPHRASTSSAVSWFTGRYSWGWKQAYRELPSHISFQVLFWLSFLICNLSMEPVVHCHAYKLPAFSLFLLAFNAIIVNSNSVEKQSHLFYIMFRYLDTKNTGIYSGLPQRIHQQVAGKKTTSQATCEKMCEESSPHFTCLPGVSTSE